MVVEAMKYGKTKGQDARREAIERYAEHVKSLNEGGKKYTAEECTLLIIGFTQGWDAHRAEIISMIREIR